MPVLPSARCERSQASLYRSVSMTDNNFIEERELMIEGEPMELHQSQMQRELITRVQNPYQAPMARTNKKQGEETKEQNLDEDMLNPLDRVQIKGQERICQRLHERCAVTAFQREQIRQKNELKEKEELLKKEKVETRKLWEEMLAQEAEYEKERKAEAKEQLKKEQLEARAVRAQQREVQKQKDWAEYKQSLRVQADVDRKMALTMAHTMNKVRKRQINAERAANKLAPQKERAAKMALQRENLAIEQALKKQAEEEEKKRLKEEREKAARQKSVHEGRQKTIREKEERKQAEQRKTQEWNDFDTKVHMMYLRSQKKAAQKIYDKNIEFSKANVAKAKEIPARAEREKSSKRECLLKSQGPSAKKPCRHYDTASQLKAAREDLPTLNTNVGRHGLLLDSQCSNCLNTKSRAPLPKTATVHTHIIQYEEYISLQQAKAGVRGEARKTPSRLPAISKRKYVLVAPFALHLI